MRDLLGQMSEDIETSALMLRAECPLHRRLSPKTSTVSCNAESHGFVQCLGAAVPHGSQFPAQQDLEHAADHRKCGDQQGQPDYADEKP